MLSVWASEPYLFFDRNSLTLTLHYNFRCSLNSFSFEVVFQHLYGNYLSFSITVITHRNYRQGLMKSRACLIVHKLTLQRPTIITSNS